MAAPRYPEFASKLRSARLRTGKSQERIAAEVGTSRRHWIRWERGDHLPSAEFMERIGEATGQPDTFAAEPEDEEAAPMAPFARDLVAALDAQITRAVAAQLAKQQEVAA